MRLTAQQWQLVEGLFPAKEFTCDRPGRPFRHPREILEGVLWVLHTGAQWRALPKDYPPYQTCHRRFQEWVRAGIFRRILEVFCKHLQEEGILNLMESFIDGSFAPAKKGATELEKPSEEKEQRLWLLPMAMVYLSPVVLKALRPMRSRSSKRR